MRGNFLSQWLLCNSPLGHKSGKKGISSVLKEVDQHGEFQTIYIKCTCITCIVHPIVADEICKQVSTLEVLVGKGQDSLIYI